MHKIQSALRLLAGLLALIGNTAMARETDTIPVPPIPKYDQVALPGVQPILASANGEAVWITTTSVRKPKTPGECPLHDIVKRTWNPATGAYSDTPLGFECGCIAVAAQITTPSGILFLMPSLCNVGSKDVAFSYQVGLLVSDGKVVKAPMQQGFLQPRLVLLSDGSVAVLERDEATKHIKLDIVRLHGGNRLSVERMPNLPIRTRNDFREAPLPDGRLMVLGGSDAQYRGCSPCRAETHILDPKTKTWGAGPPMLEPRSEHLATRLPDGSILVTGGWTPTQGWGHGPSRTAERWNPTTNKFEAIAPMPSGTSRHRAVWMPGQEGKTLLIAGGTNSSVHAYNVQTGEWRTAGATRQGSEEGGCAFIPFVLAGQTYAWTVNNTEGHYSSKSCGSQQDWELIALRTANVQALPAPERFLATYRSRAALVPANQDRPALIIGGSIHAGMNSYLVTSTVEAIDKNGGARSLPGLLEARTGATAYWIGKGALVIGGQGEDSNNSRPATRQLPMEWLASDMPEGKARWVKLPDSTFGRSSALGQLEDGSLLAVDGVSISRLTLNPGGGGLPAIRIDHDAYPQLNRARKDYDGTVVRIRGLADGRVVIAGGNVQSEKIALLREDSSRPDATDEYIGIGEYLPSRRHEIYDPAGKRWRTTAPSRGAGGKVAILPDGRVLKIGRLPGKDENDERYVMEISNADGTAWTTWPANAQPKMKLSDKAKPFVVDGELFLSGELGTLSTGGGPSGIEWLNTATGRWEALWWANTYDNWRDHLGRLIVRQLANGKKVLLPVDGY